MARQTQDSVAAPSKAWDEDEWYPVYLKEISQVRPAGSPSTFNPSETIHNAEAQLVWELEDGTSTQVRDWLALSVRPAQDKSPSRCMRLICAIAGRDPQSQTDAWIDDRTLEFGFSRPGGQPNADNWPVEGRIHLGVRVQLKGDVKMTGDDQQIARLRPKRYRPAQDGVPAPAATVPVSTMPLSPDRQWAWDGTQWIPNPNRGMS